MYHVFIENLDFYAHHGVPAEERVVGHRYVLSLSMAVEGGATSTDLVSDTVDYGEVASVVFDAATEKQYKTVERLAQVIARTVLENFSLVSSIEVRLAKRLPPAPMIAESAGVVLTLSRQTG